MSIISPSFRAKMRRAFGLERGDVGAERRQHAPAGAIVAMRGAQIGVDDDVEPLLDRHFLHELEPVRDRSVHG
jgi:hypothetical protein